MARLGRWTGASLSISTVNVQRASTQLLFDSSEFTKKGFTLTRIRGECSQYGTSISSTQLRGAMGIIMGQPSIGATTLPDPAVDMDADWIWHQSVARPFVRTVGGDTPSEGWTIDNKSQRKMSDHMELYFVVSSLISAGTINYDIAVRIYFLLP